MPDADTRNVDVPPGSPLLADAWVCLYSGKRRTSALEAVAAAPRGDPAVRSVADAYAAWQRWHVPAAAAPFRSGSAALYDAYAAAERARVEVISARHLRGMARNLTVQDDLLPRTPALARLYREVRAALDAAPWAEDGHLDAHQFAARWRDRILAASHESQATGRAESSHSPQANDDERLQAQTLADADIETDGQGDTASSDAEGAQDDEAQTAIQGPDGEPNTEPEPSYSPAAERIERWFPEYGVYSRAWDQEVDAATLLRTAEGACDLDLSLREESQLWRHAVELKRRILASHDWRWHFDRPEGQIDPRRLARLVAGRPPFEIFRVRELMGEMTAVTFLVDQSGSMKGEPQRLTILTVDLATRVLESLGIPCEILSFTTRFGGSSHLQGDRNPVLEAWQAAGKPPHPGRLNAVRHIVIKRFDHLWRQARGNLKVLAAPALGRENIDGEALHWAARRLSTRPEPRRVLLVLSDATPLDPATQQANAPLYLESHLRSVIAAIEHSKLKLAAVGMGTRLEAFYRSSLTLRRPEDIDTHMFRFLGDLLQ